MPSSESMSVYKSLGNSGQLGSPTQGMGKIEALNDTPPEVERGTTLKLRCHYQKKGKGRESKKQHMFTIFCLPMHFYFKVLLRNVGMRGQKTVFLITDTQIKEEAFLEDIDSVLNTGEVPNIFAADEKQEVMEVNAF